MEEYWQKILDAKKRRNIPQESIDRQIEQREASDDLARRIRQQDKSLTKDELAKATHWAKTAKRQNLLDAVPMAHQLLRERFPSGKQANRKRRKESRKRRERGWRDPNTSKVNYAAYMKSKAWQAKRREAFEYHGHNCTICGQYATDIDHLTYVRLGRERMKDLRPLCRGCHNNKHEGKHNCIDPVTAAFLSLQL